MNCGRGFIHRFFVLPFAFLIILFAGCIHNQAPVADAGMSRTVQTGEFVQLNGRDSYDPDGIIMEYKWRIEQKPQGSNAFLNYEDEESPVFQADISGIYVVELVVFDGELYSGRDVVVITAVNNASTNPSHLSPVLPVKVAHYVTLADSPVKITAFIPAQGHGQGSIQESTWEVVSQPDGAEIELDTTQGTTPQGTTTDMPQNHLNVTEFTANMVGEYILHLVERRNKSQIGSTAVIRVQESDVEILGHKTNILGSQVLLELSMTDVIRETSNIIDWEILTKPDNSNVDIFDVNMRGILLPDVVGIYEIEVSVTSVDGSVVSDTFQLDIVSNGQPFDHAGIIGDCVTCHNALNDTGKPASHITTTDVCESCHSVQSWISLNMIDHNEVTGACINCHNKLVAGGKSALHPSTSDKCALCHSTMNWTPLPIVDQPVATFPQGLVLSFDSEKNFFKANTGEPVKVFVTLKNEGAQNIEYYRLSSTSSGVKVQLGTMSGIKFDLTHPDDPPFDVQFVSTANLAPGDSVTRTVIWDQTLPGGEQAIAGEYQVRASVVVTLSDGQARDEFEVFAKLRLENLFDQITETEAILAGLEETGVREWYESINRSILCMTQESGTINVEDFTATPKATFAPVPDAQLNCRAELSVDAKLWVVKYRGIQADDNQFEVLIDALTGEIVEVLRDPVLL